MGNYWIPPRIKTYKYFFDMIEQPHVLIGGTTKAGKSVALQGLIFTLLGKTPNKVNLLLIDPKGVELLDYIDLPHTRAHITEPSQIEQAIFWAGNEMDRRFKTMMQNRQKMSTEADIYIIIDEYVDIKMQCSKKAVNELARIFAKGRASRIHCIVCTQRPTRDIIDGTIKANISAVLALRTHDAQESRNLIGVRGCEDLPMYGKAYYDTPTVKGLIKVDIPLIPEDRIRGLVDYWVKQK